ncbi:MAG: DUF362 domain-containing protein, partial [Nitrospinota bacterium]
MITRRTFLTGSAAVGLAAALGPVGCGREPWEPRAYRKTALSSVSLFRAEVYDEALLEDLIVRGLTDHALAVEGKRVLLKPNLVEWHPDHPVNTHPAVVGAAVEAVRRLGAREVVVAEGPGHRRDTEYLLEASGLAETVRRLRVPFVDLNVDPYEPVRPPSRYTGQPALFMPATLLAADLVISMPKLKTHHWVGATLSMKNLLGTLPGAKYGWPKNAIHWWGIEKTILDVNATVGPAFAIVDGVVAMEGDGPVYGQAKSAGVVAMGPDCVAVDATCARLMGLKPERIAYLAEASRFLGNLEEAAIPQRAEALETFQNDFTILDVFAHLKDEKA